MQTFPALGLKGGKCVGLYGGKLGDCKLCGLSPLGAVCEHNLNRADWFCIVDLDGALVGALRVVSVIASVIKAVGCRVRIGGGDARSGAHLLLGAAGVVLSASALTDFRVAFSLDAVGRCMALRGLTELSALAKLAHLKLSVLVWTDNVFGGTLSGVGAAELAKIVNVGRPSVIVSGGVVSLKELEGLYASFGGSVARVILGEAIYERAFGVEGARLVLRNC
ncbi:1-(5-phosphoribosyl)-5-[(5- phosphoribosylamino)methylideneamino] imidazole-4-carboxamide isomerase [Candidatus Hodgkinia cicadicola]|nr:1-(5-phosphoribosyl)-5-[(5- phosphoribosylamino)methylideneamino] imidazole-4-carboxamide isomerase [Candidatus Hodgkinia cicadicola]